VVVGVSSVMRLCFARRLGETSSPASKAPVNPGDPTPQPTDLRAPAAVEDGGGQGGQLRWGRGGVGRLHGRLKRHEGRRVVNMLCTDVDLCVLVLTVWVLVLVVGLGGLGWGWLCVRGGRLLIAYRKALCRDG